MNPSEDSYKNYKMEQKPTLVREGAKHIIIQQIVAGKIIQEEEGLWFMLPSLEKVQRINLIATILLKEKLGNITNVKIDDGTGQIVLRFFENLSFIEALEVGNTILIIGKPRTYNQEVYLSPEIVKKVVPLWLKVRRGELREQETVTNGDIEEKKIKLPSAEESPFPTQKLMQLIKELDHGEGALVEDILEQSSFPETEQLIEKLVEIGDIFQNLPGRVKLL